MTTRNSIACSLALAAGLAGSAGAADNQLTLRVTGGPYSGTYQTQASTTICMKSAGRDVLSSAWKDFKADGKALAEAGVEVAHPDAAGQKHGTVRIAFGKDGKAAIYQLVQNPLTLALTAQGARITADGKTAEGISIHLEAVCNELERL